MMQLIYKPAWAFLIYEQDGRPVRIRIAEARHVALFRARMRLIARQPGVTGARIETKDGRILHRA